MDMGYEALLVIPVIFFVGITVARFSRGLWRIFFLLLTIGGMYFYTFVFPAPLGVSWSAGKVYWRGGSGAGGPPDFFGSLCRRLGIEFVDQD